MGLPQSFAHLLGDVDCLTGAERPHFADQTPQILPPDIFHGDVVGPLLLVEIEHPGDVLMDDLPRQFELVRKALDRLAVQADLGLDKLEGHLFVKLLVQDPVDPAHAAFTQLFDNLVSAGEGGAGG